VKEVCREILSSHASTKERLPILDEFYQRIFEHTGQPKIIFDLACALNPFALPWMNLPGGVKYYAYDLHQPRLEAINALFRLNHLPELAVHQDILLQPPTIEADVAFFFKEAHRFEIRQKGCNRAFWQQIKARHLLVSLPTASLTGRHSKVDQHRRLVYDTIAGLNWQVYEIEFENEMVFCIEKINETKTKTDSEKEATKC
jgi:16S rRNA (guanine(1405)-N(7))-methyltransferase